jgi:hypothetical protein
MSYVQELELVNILNVVLVTHLKQSSAVFSPFG